MLPDGRNDSGWMRSVRTDRGRADGWKAVGCDESESTGQKRTERNESGRTDQATDQGEWRVFQIGRYRQGLPRKACCAEEQNPNV